MADQVDPDDNTEVAKRFPKSTMKFLIEAISTIREMHNAGTPLYTKETLSNASQQLEALKGQPGKVWLPGLDGKLVCFDLETGSVYPDRYRPNVEYVVITPVLLYRTFYQMTSIKWNLQPDTAYCVIQIDRRIQFRDKLTKEPLEAKSTIPFEALPTNPFDAIPLDTPEAMSMNPLRADSMGPLIDVREKFLRIRQLWENSRACDQLKLVLGKKLPCNSASVVTFAIGSMTFRQQFYERSAFQQALAFTLRDAVKVKNNLKSLECYAQDPAYDSADKSILEEEGFTVLDDPKAFFKVSESSVVISCAPQIPVRQIVADIARPAAMIWNKIPKKDFFSGFFSSDDVSPRACQELHDHYEELTFPGDKNLFGDLAIYVSREGNLSGS